MSTHPDRTAYGGYVHRPPHAIQTDTPLENIVVVVRAARGQTARALRAGTGALSVPSPGGALRFEELGVQYALRPACGVWGGGRPTAYGNMPQHRWRNPWPEGGNEVRTNGSAFWVPFEEMYFIHSWGTWSRIAYFYQKDLGEYVPPPEARAQP